MKTSAMTGMNFGGATPSSPLMSIWRARRMRQVKTGIGRFIEDAVRATRMTPVWRAVRIRDEGVAPPSEGARVARGVRSGACTRAGSFRRVGDNAPYLGAFCAAMLWVALTGAARAEERVDILVQGAEKLEIGMIREALTDARKVEVGPFSFWVGKVGPHKVAVSLTGQGLINCTAATVLGIEEFSPKLIVNQGTSGAQAPYLDLHDIIVGQRALDYGNFVTPVRASGTGSDALGWTPLPQKIRKGKGGDLIAYPQGFDGDAACIEVAMRTRNPMGALYAGVIGSAHEINLELDRVKWSRDTFGMDVEEMESGHVAALAHAYGVRYVAFRVVSDAPYDGVPFYALAGRAGALFTVNFLKNLPALE